MRVHQCEESTCHKVIPINQRWCDVHIKQHQQYQHNKRTYQIYNQTKRNQKANDFYHSKQWQIVRKYVVNRDEYTSSITQKVLNDHDIIVDHIVPLRVDSSKALDTSNLWCLSRSEHNVKTQIEEQVLQSRNGLNKLRHCSKEWWKRVIKQSLAKKHAQEHLYNYIPRG